MKTLLLLALASVWLVSSAPGATKAGKLKKDKQKSFTPVSSADAGGYGGHYVGIESEFWVDVQTGPGEDLRVTVYENGRPVPLKDIELTGSRLEATKILPGDVQAAFEATFGERR